ncbi:Uncharacterised protein [Kingella potus]|uniref:Uncharacterized protein n=1 Tax=Kingella potus TaxID=265175 RepID=A0A377R1J8_9NEIS|nr:Uncharacterised protein [Kingella potus]
MLSAKGSLKTGGAGLQRSVLPCDQSLQGLRRNQNGSLKTVFRLPLPFANCFFRRHLSNNIGLPPSSPTPTPYPAALTFSASFRSTFSAAANSSASKSAVHSSACRIQRRWIFS